MKKKSSGFGFIPGDPRGLAEVRFLKIYERMVNAAKGTGKEAAEILEAAKKEHAAAEAKAVR